MKIKSSILACLIPVIIYAGNPPPHTITPPSIAVPQHLTTEHTFILDSRNPGPIVVRLETVHVSPTLDRATDVFEKASNAYFHTPSPFATLGAIAIGCAALYVGYKLSQIEKPQTFQKILAVVFMTGGFIAACAPFVIGLLQSRTISV